MYGRANFDLLRLRMLRAARPDGISYDRFDGHAATVGYIPESVTRRLDHVGIEPDVTRRGTLIKPGLALGVTAIVDAVVHLTVGDDAESEPLGSQGAHGDSCD